MIHLFNRIERFFRLRPASPGLRRDSANNFFNGWSFFFARSAATGIGAARIAWASVAFAYFLMQWKDVSFFYSDAGIVPRSLLHLVARSEWYLSILTASGDPTIIFSIYLVLLLSLACAALGIFPRLSTILSLLLMSSFHERDMYVLGGGDTALRALGFILSISPGIRALSVSRALEQWKHWKEKHTFLKPVQMYTWTYRMILWQTVIIYLMSLWWKLLGTTWTSGVAVETALHHALFSRWPEFTEHFLPFLPFINYGTLAFELLWLVMLLPRTWRPIPLKLSILLLGILFHGSILVFMDAGSFSLAMMAMYIGLLREEDIAWLKKICGHFKKRTVVLYDAQCGLCVRSMFILSMCDWLKTLTWRNFRDATTQKKEAAGLKPQAMKREIHVLTSKQVYKGFYAFRVLTHRLPAFWPLVPFLYIPGIPALGRLVYAKIAARRAICTHKECGL